MIELVVRLYKIVKRVLKVVFQVLPDISPVNIQQAKLVVEAITAENRSSEYQRIYSDRSIQGSKRAYLLMLLEQQGIPFHLKLKRFIIDIARAIKPQHGLAIVTTLVH
ncbi:hypothetical protein L2747_18820 [Shewanella marinintestina]|uniref:hypothetical protein n=1 Tax=Shewanella marinintestina TaxID=190305 RepID=UPI00200E64D7|nr:hypothetical protein [Shewanella marinintestina]MCL1148060.1 hypothetical protein [Shewanella marinintestina]